MKSTTIAILLLLGPLAALAPAGIVTSGSGGDIPDNNPTGFSSSVTVAASFAIVDVRVTLTDLAHTWAADLDVTLTHVATGTAVILFQDHGGPSDYGGTYAFSDAAAGDLPFFPSPIPGGTYTPEAALSAFDGENSAGTWTLIVVDDDSGAVGSLGGWTLELDSPEGEPVPEPASLLLLGAGAALVIGVRRRRRRS